MENRSPTCECEIAGYCTRHKKYKNQLAVDLCKSNKDIFLKEEVLCGNIQEPNIIKKTINIVSQANKGLKNFAFVSNEEYVNRIKICQSCPLFQIASRTCIICGCYIDYKAKSVSSSCPDNPPRW